MLKDITFGQFFPGESLLHKTDARFKIVILIVYLVLVLLAKSAAAFLFVALLTAALLRALFLPDSPGAAKGLVRMGLLAFVFGTCLALPQGIWQVAVGREGPGSLGMALFCGAAGILGAASAWRVADRGKPPAGSPEEKA